MATNRFSSFSVATAPIALGKQTVKFAPEMISYIQENECFPVGRDSRGDYLHIQLVMENGAKTASFAQSKSEHNPKYLDNLKLYFDGKTPGDGYMLRKTFEEIRKMDRKYATLPAEEILNDLLTKKFTVYLYRYNSNGKEYLQIAWNQDEYNRKVGKPAAKKQAPAKKQVVEDDLPFELDF